MTFKNGIETGKLQRIFSDFDLFCLINCKKVAQMKSIAPNASTPGATKTLILFCFLMAGVEGLEPPAPGFGDRYFRVMQGKLVAFVLNTAHRLPPIPI